MFKNKTLFFRYYLYFDFLHGFPPPKKRPSAEPEYSITAFSTNGHGRKNAEWKQNSRAPDIAFYHSY